MVTREGIKQPMTFLHRGYISCVLSQDMNTAANRAKAPYDGKLLERRNTRASHPKMRKVRRFLAMKEKPCGLEAEQPH